MPSSFSKPALDPSSSPPPISPLSQDSSEAERRLREAEERLRDAMAELQRKQRSVARGSHAELCDHADVSCVANAIGNLCQSFLLSYGVRVGIGILLRAFKLARGQSYSSLLDLKQLVSEKDLIVREEACRIGLLFGGFTCSYHALRCCLRKWRKKETPLNSYVEGSNRNIQASSGFCLRLKVKFGKSGGQNPLNITVSKVSGNSLPANGIVKAGTCLELPGSANFAEDKLPTVETREDLVEKSNSVEKVSYLQSSDSMGDKKNNQDAGGLCRKLGGDVMTHIFPLL